ncbi:uncharacterized protein ACDP82_016032 isoform 1-T1 [Pangshura tecta]
MRIFPGWGWIVFPGCWALIGPQEVRGPLGGVLTVQCWYGRGYENHIKYWCRGTTSTSCLAVVTTESEAIVKRDRVSIKDIHTFRTFIVTMKNLTEGDSGTYWCGIDRLGWDLMFSVKVNVLPAAPASPPPAPMRETTVHAASTEPPFRWTAPEVAESSSTIHSSDSPAGDACSGLSASFQVTVPAPYSRRSPTWSNAKLLDLISICEEAVQSQLGSSCRNYDPCGQISQCMTEKSHARNTLQCRVQVKELRNAYHQVQEANRRSGAAPTNCQFYKELDAILGGDPTSTVDTSVARVPVESGPNQEEEILDEDVERDPEAEDDSEVKDACSQELFSPQKRLARAW